MAKSDIWDLKFSSSSIDEFFKPEPAVRVSSGKMRVADISHLAGFQFIADDKLIRTSKLDFWELKEDQEGYFIERLVSDDDGPIKE